MSTSKDVRPEFLDAVPASSREVVEEFLSEDLRNTDQLRRDVEEYLERVADERERFEFLNMGLAEAIAGRYLDLLDEVEGESAEVRRIVQAGLLYFVEPDDADDDFSSIIGFDDDRDVLNAIAEVLDHPDLTLDD